MVYAELTGSRTKPLPSHNPWSGGSNRRPKFVSSLSRLLTPLKWCTRVPPDRLSPPCVSVRPPSTAALTGDAARAVAAAAPAGWVRTPRSRVEAAWIRLDPLAVTWGAVPMLVTGYLADDDDEPVAAKPVS